MKDRRIVAAIDGSDYSDLVLDKAIQYATLLNASVLLVYCHKKFPTLLGEPQRNAQIAEIISQAEALIKPYQERLEEVGITCESRLMEEPAAAMIIDIARIEECELIIMGSRGLNNLTGLLVGSVTNQVLQSAPCSVLVVR
ncbi:MAG: universal stress protein [Desulfofustis sp.]|nr:universal stress protein [Desulfofustis sp.]